MDVELSFAGAGELSSTLEYKYNPIELRFLSKVDAIEALEQ